MIDRRQFFAALGGVFAAAVLLDPGRRYARLTAIGTNREPILLGEVFAAPARCRLRLSVWSPQNSFEFRLEGAVSNDGPWSPVEMLSSPRFVRVAFVDGERAAIGPVLEAGGEYEEERSVKEEVLREEGAYQEDGYEEELVDELASEEA